MQRWAKIGGVVVSLALAACTTSVKPERAPASVEAAPILPEPTQCPEPQLMQEPAPLIKPSSPKPVPVTLPEKASVPPAIPACTPDTDKLIVGRAEWVEIKGGPRSQARIDSGATTTSLGVKEQQRFQRDGKPWVRFVIESRETGKTYVFKRPLLKTTKIKSRSGDAYERPEVEMTLTLGSLTKTLSVNLADRAHFTYPVLIGRDFLANDTLIDVSQEFRLLKDTAGDSK